jgi:hypothetical protein
LGNQGISKCLENKTSGVLIQKYSGVALENSFSAHFNGFNYLDCGFNHLVSSELSFSIWYKSTEDSIDSPLLSTISKNSGYKISTLSFEYYNCKGELIKPTPDDVKEILFARKQIIKKNEWINKIVIFSGPKVKEFYNGILINEIVLSNGEMKHGKQLFIGAFVDDLNFEGFRGEIGSLKVFNFCISKNLIEKEQLLRYE